MCRTFRTLSYYGDAAGLTPRDNHPAGIWSGGVNAAGLFPAGLSAREYNLTRKRQEEKEKGSSSVEQPPEILSWFLPGKRYEWNGSSFRSPEKTVASSRNFILNEAKLLQLRLLMSSIMKQCSLRWRGRDTTDLNCSINNNLLKAYKLIQSFPTYFPNLFAPFRISTLPAKGNLYSYWFHWYGTYVSTKSPHNQA